LNSSEQRAGRVSLKLILTLVTIIASVWFYISLFEEVKKPLPYSTPPNRNTQSDVAYIGDKACARCHSEIAEMYSHHPMGCSMASPEHVLPEASGKVIDLGDLTYWIERRDGHVYHQERTTHQNGGAAQTTEHEVRYVIGSSVQDHAFLVERDDELFLSPISWDSQEQKWQLAPGYQKSNQHFDRKVGDDCLYCHSNRFEKSKGQPIRFDGLSIGCERCHGPGELHARDPKVSIDGTPTIVNPAKLRPASLRESVCEQCHFRGYNRAEIYDGSALDYRPGLLLSKFFAITEERLSLTHRVRPIGHVEQMRKSLCYRESKKELGCISCHDPHSLPEPSERIAYYQKRCLECHANRGCSLSADVRLKKSPQNDCIKCHMPKLPPSNVAHSAITDHTIPRLPE
jgi:hypothetical protein